MTSPQPRAESSGLGPFVGRFPNRSDPPHDRLLALLVVLVAGHSLAVGLALVCSTRWGLAFGGWTGVSPLFFPRQAGVFHFVVAAAYLIEYFRYRGVAIMITAKTMAVVFLVDAAFRYGGPWAVSVTALGDGVMLALVVWMSRRSRRQAVLRPQAVAETRQV